MVLDIKEYEGSQPYVFVSYCRADSKICGELLGEFRSAGVRFWYDHQINPGEDWINIIASHLKACSVCVAIITRKFIESYNCNNELAFAKEQHIPIVPILVDDVQMTLGMRLMMAGSQHLRISSQGSHSFVDVLKSEQVQKCLDPDRERLERERLERERLERERQERERLERERLERERLERERLERERQERERLERERLDRERLDRERLERERQERERLERERLERERQERERLERERQKWEHPQPGRALLSVDPETGKSRLFSGKRNIFDVDARIVITDRGDNPVVQVEVRDHDMILHNYSIRDVYADYRRIAPGEKLEAPSGAVLMFGREQRVLCIGSLLEKLVKQGRIGLLRCGRTRESMPVLTEPLPLGRKYVWPKGTLDDELLNEEHCIIEQKNGFYVRDLDSVNGTLVNGRFTDGSTPLSHGDSLQLGQTFLQFSDVRLDITE